MNIEDKIRDAGAFLGHKNLKPFQTDVIKSVVSGQDVFLISPTGSGKSLTYEAMPLVFEGKKDNASVIIVSPLVDLVEAQIKKLEIKGLSAIHINKDSTSAEIDKSQFIFASPEMLLDVRRDLLLSTEIQNNVVAVFIDEGHCILKWGRDDPKTKKEAFRSHYGRIGEIMSLIRVPMVVMTATATPAAKNEMLKLVGFRGHFEVLLSPDRDNIRYTVIKMPTYDLYTVFKSTLDDIEREHI